MRKVKQPLVSVVIPTKNNLNSLIKCLDSLDKQTYKKTEAIIISQNTSKEIKKIQQQFGFKLLSNGLGKSESRNYGSKYAKGKYLLHLDDDMVLEKNIIQECVYLAEEKKYQAVAIPERQQINKTLFNKIISLEKHIVNFDKHIEAPRFIEKNLFAKLNGFNPQLDPIDEGDIKAKLEENNIDYALIRSRISIISDKHIFPLKKRVKRMYQRGQKRPLFNILHPQSKLLKPFQRLNPYLNNFFIFFKQPIIFSFLISIKFIDLIALKLGSINITNIDKKLINNYQIKNEVKNQIVNIKNKNYKIGILIDKLNTGGVSKIALQQTRAFIEAGYNTKLFILTRSNSKETIHKKLLLSIPFEYLDDRFPSWLKFKYKIPFFRFFSFYHILYPFILPFYFKKNEINIMIVHNYAAGLSAVLLKLIHKINYIYYLWDPIYYIIANCYKSGPIKYLNSILLIMAKLMDKTLINNSSGVISSGDYHKSYIKKQITNSIKYLIIPPGINIQKIKTSIKRKENIIFTMTAWKEGKRLEDLIELMPKLDSKIILRVGGYWQDKNYYKKIIKLISLKGIKNKIQFTGILSENKLVTEYRRACMLVTVNNEVGFGYPTFEAAAYKCPFIVTTNSGVSNFFKNKEDCLYFQYGNNLDLTKKIQYLLKENKKRNLFGENSYKKVINNYTWDKHIKTIEIKFFNKYV